ncbi:hypothetical protein D7X33_31535, partial [Butyricicoccus sp. 1XD8-22]
MEVWKTIKGYEGYYEVSNLGRVRSLARIVVDKSGRKHNVKSKILKSRKGGPGYLTVNLNKDGKGKTFNVHRLVAEQFIPNVYNKRVVNHIDGNKTHNHVNNLEWVTHSENHQHALSTG